MSCQARATWMLWLCAWSALSCAACKTKLPDGVFACDGDADCPSGFKCRESLCRRGSASEIGTSADAATPSESMVTPDAASTAGKTASGGAGERGAASGSGGANAAAGGESAKDAGPKVVPPPPPPPFTPHTFVPLPSGRSITAGGAYMQSSHYRLWTAVGQAPGTGYPVRSSANHRLVGGIIGVLQSEP